MTINDYKQLDSLILEETNVKQLERKIAKTEKGDFCLVFDNQRYFFTLDGKEMSDTSRKEILKLEVLKGFYKEI